MMNNWFNVQNYLKPQSIIYCLLLVSLIQFDTISCGFNSKVNNDELYQLLNVSKTATTKQIRIAFKKLALVKHPDKNKDDPNANELFIRINRAYEILKDDELRKKYDMYGEDGLKDNQNQGNQYQSWNFYNQNFGIYDDDAEIITLSRSDFMQYVESTDTIWFINFYSTQCSHCHDLAPTWRELAKQLDGVVRIGAVNCMDDWSLCNQQQIQAFPSLIMYPKRAKFAQHKSIENLLHFALSFTKGDVVELNSIDTYLKRIHDTKPWLISFCLRSDDTDDINFELNCLDDSIKHKIAIMLNGLVNVASIECNPSRDLCNKLRPVHSNPIAFYSKLPNINDEASNDEIVVNLISTSDYKQIAQQVLAYLPDLPLLDENEFKQVLKRLRFKETNEKPWLIQFVNDFQQNQENELKRLPSLLQPNFNVARVDCAKLKDPTECFNRFQIHKYPTYILFKSAAYLDGLTKMNDNWYEINYNTRLSSQDLAAFVKENAFTHVRTLTQFEPTHSLLDSQTELNDKLGFFVDFFAPWCPPCMNLLPEFRKASKLENSKSFLFGTIDCTINQRLCEHYNVRSYPTTILFNNTNQFQYTGHHTAQDISEFIQDVLTPSVITLSYDSFYKLVANKPVGKLWLVDFYASWCGPCQQLEPEWRKLAKKFDKEIVLVGKVDCVVEQKLCMEQGINSYPNIRAYPANSKGTTRFQQYQGWMRDANTLMQWASDFLPSKTHMLDYQTFETLVLKNDGDEPWLIDFYAPWCGHCHVFAPKFETIAEKLEGKVKCGKVNCQEQQWLCQQVGIQGFPTIMFYPITKSAYANWRIGENILQYEVDPLINVVDAKLKSYGYKKAATGFSTKTEL